MQKREDNYWFVYRDECNCNTSGCCGESGENEMWMKVNYLLEEQERVMLKIKNFNDTPITNDKTSVSAFLNLSSPDNSPDRKRKAVPTAEFSNILDSAIEDDTILPSTVEETIDIENENYDVICKKSKVND